MRLFLLTSVLLAFGAQDAFGQTFWLDGFEFTTPAFGGGTRVVSGGHINSTDGTFCANGRYFFRTTTTGVNAAIGMNEDFGAVVEGINIWRAENLPPCIVNPDTITWTGIDITGMTNLIVGGRFAAQETTSFETGDRIVLEWQIDGGGFATGLSFSATAATNADLALNGTTPLLTTTLTDFTFNPGSTGATLDLRVTVSIDSGAEEIALDLFQVGGNNLLPVEVQSFSIE